MKKPGGSLISKMRARSRTHTHTHARTEGPLAAPGGGGWEGAGGFPLPFATGIRSLQIEIPPSFSRPPPPLPPPTPRSAKRQGVRARILPNQWRLYLCLYTHYYIYIFKRLRHNSFWPPLGVPAITQHVRTCVVSVSLAHTYTRKSEISWKGGNFKLKFLRTNSSSAFFSSNQHPRPRAGKLAEFLLLFPGLGKNVGGKCTHGAALMQQLTSQL